MRVVLKGVLLLITSMGIGVSAWCQSIRLDGRVAQLGDVLEVVQLQAGIDLVYADALLRDRHTTCGYQGNDVRAALRCALDGTSLEAIQVGPRQFVLRSIRVDVKSVELSGRVVDQSTGEALLGAHVYLPISLTGTSSSGDGTFRVTGLAPGTHRVLFSFVGYQSVDTVVVLPSESVQVSLQPRPLDATTLLVLGDSGNRPDLSLLPGAVSVDANELETIPTSLDDQDLFQTLEMLPGIERSGETRGGLSVRGGTPDQNLYLLDGAPVYHPSHAFSLISTFQTETLSSVNFYRGSFPAEHGGMLSAVLDARLKDGRGDRPRATVGINALNARFLVETPITSASSFMVSARRSYVDKLIGKEHPVEEDGRVDTLRTGYYFYDWSAKLSFRPAEHSRLSLTYYRGRDDLDLKLPFDLSLNFSDWLRPADLFFEVGHRWGNEIFSLHYQYVVSPGALLSVTAYESSYRATERTLIQPTMSAVVTSEYFVALRDIGANVGLDLELTDRHALKAGAKFIEHQFQSSLQAVMERSAGLTKDVDQSNAMNSLEVVVFAEHKWRPTTRWMIEPGVRATMFAGAGGLRANPRLSAAFALNRILILRGAAGSEIQYLHRLRDNYSLLYDLVSSRWVPADGTVRPSTSHQVAFGAEVKPDRRLRFSADTYYRFANDVLMPRDELQSKDGLEGPGIDVSALLGEHTAGKTRSFGLELTGEFHEGPWRALATYAGARSMAKAVELGEVSFRRSRYDIPRSLRTSISWSRGRWSISALAIARAGYPETVPTARYSVGSPLGDSPAFLHRPKINNGRLPAYARLDLFAGYRFGAAGALWQINLHLYNVTNRRNVVGRQYDPSTSAVTVIERSGLPILPLLEIVMDL